MFGGHSAFVAFSNVCVCVLVCISVSVFVCVSVFICLFSFSDVPLPPLVDGADGVAFLLRYADHCVSEYVFGVYLAKDVKHKPRTIVENGRSGKRLDCIVVGSRCCSQTSNYILYKFKSELLRLYAVYVYCTI